LAEKQKDDLVREKHILLQELQHRVANSLQIIASVLTQSANRVQSEETRLHLHDAHSRFPGEWWPLLSRATAPRKDRTYFGIAILAGVISGALVSRACCTARAI
jgi:hypothetical protein